MSVAFDVNFSAQRLFIRRSSALLVIAIVVLSACRRSASAPRLPDGGLDRGKVIDSHTLITPVDESIDRALKVFEQVGITRFCNKNAGPLGSRSFAATARIKHRLGDRFAFYANLSWRGVNTPGWGKTEADRLEQAVRYGAKGLKIFKAWGLGVRNRKGQLIPVDDPRIDPVIRRAGKIGAVVALHTSDPKAFFEPPTPDNERYDELKQAPDWSFYGADYPSRRELLDARNRLIARHPGTTFLLIHLGNNPEDLDDVARVLDRYSNVYVDTSARVPEIGRHPADKVRAFFVRFQDRILFGTDLAISPYHMQLGSVSETPPTLADAADFYRAHFRFFETDAKKIDHPTPIQGRWKIDAIALPYPVLRKLYHDNAMSLIFNRAITVPVVDPFDKPQGGNAQPSTAPAPVSTTAPATAPVMAPPVSR